MKTNEKQSKPISATRRLTESAILLALGFVLSYLGVRLFPQGGRCTLVSMLPVLLIGYRHGIWYGLGGGFVYSILQALQGDALKPPATGLGTYFLMMLLDYVVAFTVLGLSALFRRKRNGLVWSVPFCLGLRFISHVISGVLLWGSYAWSGWGVWPYSIAYSATYMVPEIILTTVAARFLIPRLPAEYRDPV